MTRNAIFAALALLLLALNVPAVEYQQGLDVSHWQGNIDWIAVKNAGIKFAFAKATEGQDFVDVNSRQYMADAMATGVPIGPYHFARTNSGETDPLDAVKEADDFVDEIQQYYQSSAMILRPVLDLEQLPNDPVSPSVSAYVSQWARDFSGEVQARLGFGPIIYTCCNFQYSILEPDINQYALWLAKSTSSNVFDPALAPTASDIGIWNDWTFWQWSYAGDVGGISPVDRDAFAGTMEQLAQYIPTYHAGDFDRNGIVDAGDYVVWRKTMGQTVNMGTAADGNLNGTVDTDDLRIWRANFGKTYPAAGLLDGHTVPEADVRLLAVLAAFAGTATRLTRCPAY